MADNTKDKAEAERRAAEEAKAREEAERKAREEAEAAAQEAGAKATAQARAQALRTTQEMEAEQPYPSQEEADRMKVATSGDATHYATRDLKAK